MDLRRICTADQHEPWVDENSTPWFFCVFGEHRPWDRAPWSVCFCACRKVTCEKFPGNEGFGKEL
jgi:hypothetical protein